MKLLLLTNSYDTKRTGSVATFAPANQFTAHFNRVVELPRYCQMCIISTQVDDADASKIHYVEFTNLPIDTVLGNASKGGNPKIIGHLISDVAGEYIKNWVDLNNPAPMTITDIQVKIVNQDGQLSSGLTNQTELLCGYRSSREE
tara:strand:+ start:43 stop:477 length:435 start_codon:yes stop_codon:yes gene_type:complete